MRCARPTGGGATRSLNRSAAPAGTCRRRAPRCLPGRRSPSRLRRSAAWNFRRCWSRRRASQYRPAPASANTARATCASRWSRTSSASAKPPATSGAFLKPGRKCCTTWFLSPRGVSRASHLSFWQALMAEPLKVGLAGLGTVGTSVVRLLEEGRVKLVARCGRPIEIVAISARSRAKKRGVDLKKYRWVAEPLALARDPSIDVLVEVIGGAGDPAKSAVEAALVAGKPVVTANKALLARHGQKLAALAERQWVALNFEASVGGGIPIVKTLREGLGGDSFARIYGILNGT